MSTAATADEAFGTRDDTIRAICRADFPELLNIGVGDIETAWSKRDFEHFLRQRHIDARVYERRDGILGFMVYELHRRTISVLKLAVADEARRGGVATAMFDYLAAGLRPEQRYRVSAAVRETNDPHIAGPHFVYQFKTGGMCFLETLEGFFAGVDLKHPQSEWFASAIDEHFLDPVPVRQ